jgi:hypothetical protein
MLNSRCALYVNPLHHAALAIDDVHSHLRANTNSTDAPVGGAVQAADLLDVIADLLECGVQRWPPLP